MFYKLKSYLEYGTQDNYTKVNYSVIINIFKIVEILEVRDKNVTIDGKKSKVYHINLELTGNSSEIEEFFISQKQYEEICMYLNEMGLLKN